MLRSIQLPAFKAPALFAPHPRQCSKARCAQATETSAAPLSDRLVTDTPRWSPSSWQSKKAWQQPEYPDEDALKEALSELERCPPLVFAGEARILEEKLAAAALGKAFLLQVDGLAFY